MLNKDVLMFLKIKIWPSGKRFYIELCLLWTINYSNKICRADKLKTENSACKLSSCYRRCLRNHESFI